MIMPAGIALVVLLLSYSLSPAAQADSTKVADSTVQINSTTEVSSSSEVNSSKPVAADPAKRRFQRPAALKRLVFSAKQGFALKMVSNQDVTAEIRNGAGRTLAHSTYMLEPGDWTLRPRNLAPGLYTVLLRTGPQLRSMRMKIEGSERGVGSPEWVLEKGTDTSPEGTAQQGAFLSPAPE